MILEKIRNFFKPLFCCFMPELEPHLIAMVDYAAGPAATKPPKAHSTAKDGHAAGSAKPTQPHLVDTVDYQAVSSATIIRVTCTKKSKKTRIEVIEPIQRPSKRYSTDPQEFPRRFQNISTSPLKESAQRPNRSPLPPQNQAKEKFDWLDFFPAALQKNILPVSLTSWMSPSAKPKQD